MEFFILPHQIGQWSGYLCKILHKLSVGGAQPIEALHRLYISGDWPVSHCLDFVLAGMHTISGDMVAQKVNSSLEEVTFTGLQLQIGSSKSVKYSHQPN